MSVYLKQGVCGSYSRPIAWALGKMAKRCQKTYVSLIITSIGEANHGPGSLHYLKPSDAVDFIAAFVCPSYAWQDWEGSSLTYPILDEFKLDLSKGRFGGQFDIVDEGSHFHVEYDPKKG